MKWTAINSSDMEDEIKKFITYLLDMRGIDKRSNAFVGITDDIRKWSTFLPLLGELKDNSMNTDDKRHWREVQNIVK